MDNKHIKTYSITVSGLLMMCRYEFITSLMAIYSRLLWLHITQRRYVSGPQLLGDL